MIDEAVAQLLADGDHALDVADAVLEADQVGAALGQLQQRFGGQAGGAAVVDDDADLHALADGFDVLHQAVLRGFGQVVRQQQHALGAVALGFLRVLDGQGGAAAGAADDGHAALAGFGRDLDHLAYSCGSSEKNSPVPPAANSTVAP